MIQSAAAPILEAVPQPQHGEVRQYWRGCRCLPCRVARSRYRSTARRGELASVAPARAYLARLERSGVGYRQVAALTGLSDRWVREIRNGHVTHARPETVGKILACPVVVHDGASVTAWWPKRHIKALLEEGYSKARLTKWIGQPVRHILRAKRVTAATARTIERLYRDLVADDESEFEAPVVGRGTFDQIKPETLHG